nr:ABC transporter permease [Qipengyuania algicida]
MRRLTALVGKELTQVVRDPATILIVLVLPLILLFLFGYAVSLDASRTRVAVVLEDSSEPALSLALAYQNSRYFEVTMARTVEPVRDLMVDGKARGIIVIPQGFGRQIQTGRAAIQIITDGSQPNTANFVAAYSNGVLTNWTALRQLEAPVAGAPMSPLQIAPRYWYNPALKSRFFLVPGSIAIVMAMIGTLLTALVVAREWERGTMESLMATPMRMTEFIASKVVPYFLLGLGSMVLCSLTAVFLFGVPFRGSVIALIAMSAAYLMPALGMGLFISAATKNQFVASQIALLSSFLPSFLLSGFLFEISSMPKPIQIITYLVPARYLIPSLQTVFLAGDFWGLFWPNIAIMLGFGFGFFLLSFRMTKRSLD